MVGFEKSRQVDAQQYNENKDTMHMKALARKILGPLNRRIVRKRQVSLIKKHKSRFFSEPHRMYLQEARRKWRRREFSNLPDAPHLGVRFQRDGFVAFRSEDASEIARSVFQEIESEEKAGKKIWADTDGRYLGDIGVRFPRLVDLFDASLGDFIRAAFRSEFKIYYGIIYKSERKRMKDEPLGSQLWHADGGPGTCINVMVFLSEVAAADGAMECLPWEYSLKVFARELAISSQFGGIANKSGDSGNSEPNREEYRESLCNFYKDEISRNYGAEVVQPTGGAGTVLAFRNNILHKGGYPAAVGRTRYVCVFHVYPSVAPTNASKYKKIGLAKRGPYPQDPSEDF